MHSTLRSLCCLGIGIGSAMAPAEERTAEEPVVSEALLSGVYAVEGGFDVAAGAHTVWQVLTDYNHLPRFVPSVHKSVARIISDGGLVVDQELEAKALIFSRTLRVRLEIREQPERRIDFHDVAQKDFDVYRGSWSIVTTSVGSKVTYLLRAKPHEPIPDFLTRGAFKENAQVMLGQLRSEITHRSLRPASSPEPESQKGGS